VNMRAKGNALLRDLAKRCERHHLEAAGIGQDRPRPACKFMQAAKSSNPFSTRPQHQVIGVAENDVASKRAHLVKIHRLDSAAGAHRHEGRRADCAAWHRNLAAPGIAIGRKQAELESVSHWSFRKSSEESP